MGANRKILVTGGAGFIGTHLCRLLIKQGHDVTILDLAKPAPDLTSIPFLKIDVTDAAAMTPVLSQHWDAIYHFAAMVSVPECEKEPEQSFLTNADSFHTILNFYRLKSSQNSDTPLLIFSSSAAVYGDLGRRNHRLSENELLPHPESFYGLHKYLCEQSLRLFCKNFGLHGISFRFFNVYGPGQKDESPYSGVISKFTHAFQNNKPIQLFNHGKNERDFIHVNDIVHACTLVLDSGKWELKGQPINLCTGESVSISSVYRNMCAKFQKNPPVSEMGPRPGDIEFSCGNPDQAKNLFPGWKPSSFSI